MAVLQLYVVLAFQLVRSYFATKNIENVARLQGNVTIGGLVPVYPLDHNGKCNYNSFEGAFGMLRLEAMIFSTNEVSFF